MNCRHCGEKISDDYHFCPFCGSPADKKTAEYYEQECRRLRAMGKMRAAIQMCEHASRIGNADPYRLKTRGEIYYLIGEMDKAIECFTESIELMPDFADTHYARGLAYYRAGFPRKAIEDFQQAKKINPEFAMACNWLGIAYFVAGKLHEAKDEFICFLEKSPTSAIANYNLAQVYLAMGNGQSALEHLKALECINSENASIYYFIGKAYHQCHKISDAIASFKKAVELNPEDGQAKNFLERLLSVDEP